MMVRGTISNLVGGVSQQAPAIRLPTQSQDEVNTFPVIVDGQNRRPPTEYVGALATAIPATAYVNDIIRDISERYVVAISGGQVQVCDLAGNAKTVTYPNGQGYLATPAGTLDADNFVALTIADYTFIVNKSVATAMATTVFPARNPEALINVKAGNYGKTYNIIINGNVLASYQTPLGTEVNNYDDPLYIDTTFICGVLVSGGTLQDGGTKQGTIYPVAVGTTNLTSSGILATEGWGVSQVGNAIYIENITGADFTLSTTDGYAGNAMVAVKGDTQNFSDLPTTCPTNFVASIVGPGGDIQTRYYVQYQTNTTAVNGVGVWKECPQPGIQTNFNPSTMPHILVRNSDGTFTFQEAVWNPRIAGDATTVPVPSFVGKTINNVEFFSNRLGLYSGGNAVWSVNGDLFNFWRQSAITLLDDDPIDIQAATADAATLRAGTPYQQGLVIWSDLTQFAFSSGNNALLSPKTATLVPITAYESLSESVRPIAAPRRVYFAVDRNQYTGIREWYYDAVYRIAQADDATSHVPTFIPSGAFKIANSTIEDMLVVLSTADPSSMWVYKYYWEETQKLQSAWVRWNFPGATILSAFFVDAVLYLLVNRGGQTALETMRVNPQLLDGTSPVTYLDRRIGSDQLPAPTYDPVSDTTVYTLPYTPTSTAVFRAATRANAAAGQFQDAPVASISGAAVTLQGNTTGLLLYFGELFTTSYTFSPLFYRDPQKEAVQEGVLRVTRMDVSFAGAGYFRMEVTPLGRATRSKEWVPEVIGPYDTVGDVAIRDGVFTMPVYGDGEFVTIKIINDSFFPSRFPKAEWKGNFVPKSRK